MLSKPLIFVPILVGLVSRVAQGAGLRIVHCREIETYFNGGDRRIFIEHSLGALSVSDLLDPVQQTAYSISIQDDANGLVSTLLPEYPTISGVVTGFVNGVDVNSLPGCDPTIGPPIEAESCSAPVTNNWVIFDLPPSWNALQTSYTIVSATDYLGGICKGLYPALINLYAPHVLNGNGGIEVRHCRTPTGGRRVFVEHTYGFLYLSELWIPDRVIAYSLLGTNDITKPISNLYPEYPTLDDQINGIVKGFINGVNGNNLPGCDPLDGPPTIASTCSVPTQNNWIIFDIPSSWATTDITYSLEALDLLRSVCKGLYPSIIDLYGPSLEPSSEPSAPTSAPTASPTASPTTSPTFPVMKLCEDVIKRSTCNETEGCSWDSDGEGGGTCKTDSLSPNCQQYGKRKPCLDAAGCFWKSKGDGTGRCRECTSLEKEKTCTRQGCTWEKENESCK